MPQISYEFRKELGILSWPLGIQPPQRHTRAEYDYDESLKLRRGDRVLDPDWGIGRVLTGTNALNDSVTVQWSDAVRTVSVCKLRRLLPRTILAKTIEATAPAVTAWMVRKADHDGLIRPDAVDRFAGHKVHYYDAARIPALIEQLSNQDHWATGILVIHSDFGAGRIVGYPSDRAGNPETSPYRIVHFFSSATPARVAVRELRRLIPSHVVAKRIGVERKTFARQAARHGIQPDFICERSARTYYDEDRTEEIRRRWSSPVSTGMPQPGTLVIDPSGDLATVEFVDENGQANLRSVQDLAPTQACASRIRELVSLRELARREKMSRYKLQRLLSAAQVSHVHRHGTTIYFDSKSASHAVRTHLCREQSGLNLRTLSQRTGLSPEVLAKKIRQGCITTICRGGMHLVDEAEARRVQTVVAALNSASESLSGLGICRFQRRGRRGQELVDWDIPRLVKAVQLLTPERRSTLFDQIAWVCESAGRKQLRKALDAYLSCARRSDEDTESLLIVLDQLPSCSEVRRIRLMLTAHSRSDLQRWVRSRQNGGNIWRHHRRIWAEIEQSIRAALTRCKDLFSASEHLPPRFDASSDVEQGFVPGTVIVSVAKGNPEAGVVVRAEQRSWDTLTRTWAQTILVRFSDSERYVKAQTGSACPYPRPVLLLLDRSQAQRFFQSMSEKTEEDPDTQDSRSCDAVSGNDALYAAKAMSQFIGIPGRSGSRLL